MKLASALSECYNVIVGKLPSGVPWGEIKKAFTSFLFSLGFEL